MVCMLVKKKDDKKFCREININTMEDLIALSKRYNCPVEIKYDAGSKAFPIVKIMNNKTI